MTQVLRFMSVAEAFKFLYGKELKSTINHKSLGSKISSVGFCFAIAPDNSPTVAIHEGWGTYTVGTVDELSTTQYSQKDFKTWALYTHTQLSYDSFMRVVSSFQWVEPVLLTNFLEAKPNER